MHQHAGKQLMWGLSLRRSRCGQTAEYDGYGLPPQSFWDAVLEQGGVWGFACRFPTSCIPLMF